MWIARWQQNCKRMQRDNRLCMSVSLCTQFTILNSCVQMRTGGYYSSLGINSIHKLSPKSLWASFGHILLGHKSACVVVTVIVLVIVLEEHNQSVAFAKNVWGMKLLGWSQWLCRHILQHIAMVFSLKAICAWMCIHVLFFAPTVHTHTLISLHSLTMRLT